MNEALKALFEGQEFSEEFKAKVVAVFEAALEEKEQELTESIEQKYEQLSEEYSEYVRTEMEDKMNEYIAEEVLPNVDKYLSYATQEFMNENKLAVESGTKVELAESFLQGFKGIAEQYNVQIPEGQEDALKQMQEKLDAMQTRFDKVLDEKAELQSAVVESKREKIVSKLTKDLSESQKEKFSKVASKVGYKDDEQLEEAIQDLYESYYPSKENLGEGEVVTQPLNEGKTQDDYYSKLFSQV